MTLASTRLSWPVIAVSAVAAVGAALAWQHHHACGRLCHARELLRALQTAGATINVQLDIRNDAYGGIGVYVRNAVRENTTLLTIPRRLWLTSASCPTDPNANCPGFTQGSRLVLTLSRERRQPSSWLMAAYLKSLPAVCPRNLVARWDGRELFPYLSARHAWRVAEQREEWELLNELVPEADEAERRLLMCLKMSRAFNDLSEPPPVSALHPNFGYDPAAMVPLYDLMNHGPQRTVRDLWAAEHGVVLVAARDLQPGTELVHPYGGGPVSAAHLLLSYGIHTPVAPAAVIDVHEVPSAADVALMSHEGCASEAEGTAHILLHVAAGALGERELREGLRCLRLRLYSSAEVLWARASGYLDWPWPSTGEPSQPSPSDWERNADLYHACVRKDAHLILAARRYCAEEIKWGGSNAGRHAPAVSALPAASGTVLSSDVKPEHEDVREAVAREEAALHACSQVATAVLHAFVARGLPGVAETVSELEKELHAYA